MQQEADQSFAGPGGLSGRTRVGPYDSALRTVRKLVPAMGGDHSPSCRTAGFRVRGRRTVQGKGTSRQVQLLRGRKRPVPPESAFFGRIHTVLRGIGAVSERYVTLNLKRYRAFFP